MDDYGSHGTQAAAELLTRTVPSAGIGLASPSRLPTSRPSTASRSASTIIKQASAVAACAEIQLPSLVGTNSRVLSALLSDALGVNIDPSSVRAVETTSGVYAFVRTRPSKEKLLVALKGKQFLAPSSTELRHILDEAMLLEALRHSTSDDLPSSLVSKFPILGHSELYRTTDRIVFVTLVKDHLDSCFERQSKNQFQYTVQFNQLWSHLVQFQFFSLRHFTEAVEGDVEAAATVARHPFRKWLFLFAYQAKLQSTKPDDPRLQNLCEETISDECIAMVWEKTADASQGPESHDP